MNPSNSTNLFIVIAFRCGDDTNTFPIGVFQNEDAASEAAAKHRSYRGGKYKHRIYGFTLNQWNDDIAWFVNQLPCIEDRCQSIQYEI